MTPTAPPSPQNEANGKPDTAPVAPVAPVAVQPVQPAQPVQPRNPLHGITLEAIVTALVEAYGWEGLAERVPVRCFQSDPSVRSSLTFLRKTPWARDKVESLYLFMLRKQKRQNR
ncbi:MAG: hypothetical protein JWQ88_1190 [Rhodoferax sp.]|nr:hypothetical protein [Rhodoferax sp.]